MAIHSIGSLIDALRSFRLVSADQHEQLLRRVHGKSGDPRPLAKQLVQRGWLTVYQMNQLLTGNGKTLAVGSYRVLDRLGQGGLSHVFKARHVEYEFTVALKVIRPEVLTNAEGRHQFLQEIEAMTRLDHPNIVQFCDADQHEQTCFFAMEYVDGIDLAKHVRLSGPASVRDACDYIRQAALGLQHAHERNLVHRDIKPVNLFLTYAPVAQAQPAAKRGGAHPAKVPTRAVIKILDWGLAKLRCPNASGTPPLDLLSKGLVGTADYLSPEQARNASAVDIRGDIYSLGCTLYYLLTGCPPFPHGTLMQKVLQHQQAEPALLDTYRGDVPPALAVVLQRMLAKTPEERYQTPAALALALLPFTRGAIAAPSVANALAAPKGTPPAEQRDDTPLPVALGREPRRGVPRMARTDSRRNADPSSDTACA
jgi:serine/threonine-protein kinase